VQALNAAESGAATIRVRRTLGLAGAVSIQYATSDGTATAGVDYTATSGTLNWADGDLGDKTFPIAFTSEANIEPDETLVVTLSNAAGGATLEGSSTLTVTIVNDDAASSGGGGGGAMNLLFLAVLALLAASRRRVVVGAASAAIS
jgi:hypothetical protein